MQRQEIYNPLYRLLIDPKFRLGRHTVFIFSLGIIFVNHVYLTYEGQTDSINILAIAIGYILFILSIMYLNIYWLIPKLLLKGGYCQYIIVLLFVICFILIGDIYTEYYVHRYYQIPFGQFSFFSEERYKFLDLLSNFFIFTLYFVSITSVVFYKHWLLSTQKLEQLKARQLRTDLNKLKNRISAEFLLDKLGKVAEFCKTAPLKVSTALLLLSRVLRYQLYDCGRESVLLSSEIKFLNDYLKLEEVCNSNFRFKISYPITQVNLFVPPLLLISFIEEALSCLSQQNEDTWIDITFIVVNDHLTFVCSDNRTINSKEENEVKYSTILERLKLLNTKEYNLAVESDENMDIYRLIFKYQF